MEIFGAARSPNRANNFARFYGGCALAEEKVRRFGGLTEVSKQGMGFGIFGRVLAVRRLAESSIASLELQPGEEDEVRRFLLKIFL